MVFRYKNQGKSTWNIRQSAILKIYHYTFRRTDIDLENLLREKYNMNLRQACIILINNIQYQHDSSGTLIMTFPNRELDKLAAIITYGNGSFPGSRILIYALARD